MADVLAKTGPAEAARRLAEELAHDLATGAPPHELERRVDALVDSIRSIDLANADPYTVKHLLAGALDVAAAADPSPRSRPASMAIGLETVRQALDRYLERQVLGDDRPLSEVVHWLLDTTHLSPPALAEILDVSPGTVRRWSELRSPPLAETDEMGRARVLAQVVLQLSHVLTSRGVVSWLEAEHPALKVRPKDLLNEPAQLLSLASQGRSQNAS